jgi:ribosomal protein S12 methylthiotransferase accessory factor
VQTPRFKPHFHLEILAPDIVYLLSEQGHHVLRGRLYFLIAPLLDGEHTQSDIITRLDGQASPVQVQYTLARLRKAGFLIDDDVSLPDEQAAFWAMQGAALERLPGACVSVRALGDASAAYVDDLTRALDALHTPVVDDGAVLDVVLVDDYLHPDLAALNERALASGRPWVPAKLLGGIIWVGPVFEANDESACWACLAQRLEGNRAVETFIKRERGYAVPLALSRAALPTTVQMGVSLLATEVARWLASGEPSPLKNTLVTFDFSDLQTRHHTLVKRPQCSVCGEEASAAPKSLVLQRRPKATVTDGGHRSAPAAETLARYRHHVSPITGAVNQLIRVPGTGDAYIYLAGYNRARLPGRWQAVQQGLRSACVGKGVSATQAQVSALCEALERYSSVFQGGEVHHRASYQALTGEAIHPHDCLHFSESQYQNRDAWNAGHPPHLEVPHPFDETRPIDWTRAWSLTNEAFRYVPTAYCYYDYPQPTDYFFCSPDSNGSAAGSSLEDAILQGFMELVERDAVAIWWYNRVKRPAVDLEALNEPYIARLRRYYASIERAFWVLDLTTDLGIPCCAAVSRRTERSPEAIIMGFGAHFDARIAVLRALTEMNQMLPAMLNASDGAYNSGAPWEIEWWQTATIEAHPYLAPAEGTKPVRLAGCFSHEDLRDDVRACVDIARGHGMEVLALDQTRPDVGLPVVKVIVPGLRHYWARFAPGRLYDVPVSLGWLGAPLDESALNATPLFL